VTEVLQYFDALAPAVVENMPKTIVPHDIQPILCSVFSLKTEFLKPQIIVGRQYVMTIIVWRQYVMTR